MRILCAVLGFTILVSSPAQEDSGKLLVQAAIGVVALLAAFLWKPIPFDNEVN